MLPSPCSRPEMPAARAGGRKAAHRRGEPPSLGSGHGVVVPIGPDRVRPTALRRRRGRRVRGRHAGGGDRPGRPGPRSRGPDHVRSRPLHLGRRATGRAIPGRRRHRAPVPGGPGRGPRGSGRPRAPGADRRVAFARGAGALGERVVPGARPVPPPARPRHRIRRGGVLPVPVLDHDRRCRHRARTVDRHAVPARRALRQRADRPVGRRRCGPPLVPVRPRARPRRSPRHGCGSG